MQKLTLITGPETFLAEREVSRQIARAQSQIPEARVAKAAAAQLTPADLEQLTGTDLFSSATITCITGAEKTPREVEKFLLDCARTIPDHLTLIISHAAGREGKSLLDKLTPLAGVVLPHPPLKAKDLPGFVMEEVRSLGRDIAASAARALVDAVGSDTRSLVGAITQLLADSPTQDETISTSTVNQYFAGMATITQYAVSDDVLAGRVSDAIVKLRWALSTGVPHLAMTSALASSLRQIGNYLSLSGKKRTIRGEDIGIPDWKLRSFTPMAQAWSPTALAAAIRAVSQADAQVKGASTDPDYALERLIIRLAHLRRTAHS